MKIGNAICRAITMHARRNACDAYAWTATFPWLPFQIPGIVTWVSGDDHTIARQYAERDRHGLFCNWPLLDLRWNALRWRRA
jgi:hypothetical protein